MLPSAVAQNSELTVPATVHDDDDDHSGDEIVETSDAEEQEEQRATSYSYWWSQSPQKRFRDSEFPLSPRKRVKVCVFLFKLVIFTHKYADQSPYIVTSFFSNTHS